MNFSPITEIKHRLIGTSQRFESVRLAEGDGEVVVLYRMPVAARVEHIVLPAGTLSLGYFWESRPYNIYHWYSPGGSSLGLYINVCDRTRISDGQVQWRDLVVDLLLDPRGDCRVLDEHELPVDLEPELLGRIERVRDELVRSHRQLKAECERRSPDLLRGAGVL